MKRTALRAVTFVVLATVGSGFFARSAAAQGRTIPHNNFPSAQANNPSFVPTQLQANAFQQWAQQTAVVGQVYSQNYAPWVIHNPYPQVVNNGPVIQTPIPLCPPLPPGPVPPVSQPAVPLCPPSPVAVAPASACFNPYANPYTAVVNPYSDPDAACGN